MEVSLEVSFPAVAVAPVLARHELVRHQWLRHPRARVFAFFADAGNLEDITPPWLHFHILTPRPIAMAPGALIDYRLRLFGVPIRWRTRIERFVPEREFVDVQVAGPYAVWHHQHLFEEQDGGTLVIDRVRYSPGFGVAGRIAHPLLVRPALRRIFDYRRARIAAHFP